MRISDWSSDVCSSDLLRGRLGRHPPGLVEISDALSPIPRRAARAHDAFHARSEARRVGKECVSTCRSRWWPYHQNKKQRLKTTSSETHAINYKTSNNKSLMQNTIYRSLETCIY